MQYNGSTRNVKGAFRIVPQLVILLILGLFFLLISVSGSVYARDMQADAQCKSGGVVGQKCKDTTNGYVTNGHCTYVHVCRADSWSESAPSGCGSSGDIKAPTSDCPKAPPIGSGSGGAPFDGSRGVPAVSSEDPENITSLPPLPSSSFEGAFSSSTTATTVSQPRIGGDSSSTAVRDLAQIADPATFFNGQTIGARLVEAPPGYRVDVSRLRGTMTGLSATNGDGKQFPTTPIAKNQFGVTQFPGQHDSSFASQTNGAGGGGTDTALSSQDETPSFFPELTRENLLRIGIAVAVLIAVVGVSFIVHL